MAEGEEPKKKKGKKGKGAIYARHLPYKGAVPYEDTKKKKKKIFLSKHLFYLILRNRKCGYSGHRPFSAADFEEILAP
jgi:hypothetical protein